jgi:hypothetical protein
MRRLHRKSLKVLNNNTIWTEGVTSFSMLQNSLIVRTGFSIVNL